MSSFRERAASVRQSPVFPLVLLMGAYYFLQGMGGNPGIHRQALESYLKNTLGLSPPGQAEFFLFITIPWMVKPLYGILSDSVPIFGYRRVSYFILASVASITAYVFIAFFGYTYGAVLVLYALAMLGFALSDVLCDAVMVEKGKPLGATDRLQGAQWAAIAAAGVILTFAGGYVAEYLPFQKAVLISAIFPALVILVTLLFLREKREASVAESAKKTWEGVKAAAKLRPLWGCAFFILLYNLSPSIGTALYNYQQDVLGFTQIDIGHLRTIAEIGFLIGAFLFTLYCRKLSERALLNLIIWVGVLTTLAYLFYTASFARAAVIEFATGLVGVSAMLGILTIAARACPAHAEGTVFALLMSVYNFGKEISNVIGGMLYEILGYRQLIFISAAFTAAMWFLLPLVESKPIRKTYLIAAGFIAVVAVLAFVFRSSLSAYIL